MPKGQKSKNLKNYKHDDKRKNIPEVGLVSNSTDQTINKKTKYKHDPFIEPSLSWAGKIEYDEF